METADHRQRPLPVAEVPESPGFNADHLLATLAGLVSSLVGGYRDDPTTVRRRVEATLTGLPGVRHARLQVHAWEVPDQDENGAVRFALPGLGPDAALVARLDAELTKPLDDFFTRVAIIVAPVLLAERWLARVGQPEVPTASTRLVGASSVMRELKARVDKLARSDFAVLIEGESGSGKELVARRLHEHSRRKAGPFVAVNCAALVDSLVETELFGIEDRTATGVRGRRGKFEQANGGTLFLDEVGDLTLAAQAKLLRVLQEYSVERVGGHATHRLDVRVVAATNRNLASMVRGGTFRSDLYHRLNCLEVYVPPLRERREDIQDLAAAVMGRHRRPGSMQLSARAQEALLHYDWPGNVRELERSIERAIAMADGVVIGIDDLPGHVTGRYREVLVPSAEARETLRTWGRRYARLVLAECNFNKRKACRVLGISYHTLEAYVRATHGRGHVTGPAANAVDQAPAGGSRVERRAGGEGDGSPPNALTHPRTA
ncbi:MAG: sigma-54 dependent transcriptional regulator [Vicinamibacterales bacterium]